MNSERPLGPTGSGFERGLLWMIGASALAHSVIIAALVLFPHSFLHRPPAMVSYVVDLVSPDQLGGTNMVSGTKGKPVARPKEQPVKPRAVEPRREARPLREVAEQKPKPKILEAKPKPPRPPKPDEQQIALARPTNRPTATPRPTHTVLPTSTLPPVATATHIAVKVVPTVRPKPTNSRKPTLRPTYTEKPKPAPTKAEARKARKHASSARMTPTPRSKPSPRRRSEGRGKKTHAGKPAKEKVKKEKAEKEAHERDRRIEAAIKRLEAQRGVQGGGAGGGQGREAGGPISIGPGEGAGGIARSVEYIMYKNRVEGTIKSKWTWAGRNRKLKAVVGFSILPSGEIANVHTITPSGDPSYDLLAERAVRAASPLPPPPQEYQAEFMQYELTFEPQETGH